jgi:heme exporter protein B
MSAVGVLFRRELSLAWGGGGGPLLACAFFLCLTAIQPLAAGGDPRALAPVAVGVAWLALALAALLSLERLFERDYEDGALDLLATGPLPLEAVFAVKAVSQWLATGLPLACARRWRRWRWARRPRWPRWCSPRPCWAASASPSPARSARRWRWARSAAAC